MLLSLCWWMAKFHNIFAISCDPNPRSRLRYQYLTDRSQWIGLATGSNYVISDIGNAVNFDMNIHPGQNL